MNVNMVTKILKYICTATAAAALFVNAGKFIKANGTAGEENKLNNQSIPETEMPEAGAVHLAEKEEYSTVTLKPLPTEDEETTIEKTDEDAYLKKEEANALHVGQAWYEHLFNTNSETPQILDKGYNAKKYVEVIGKQIYTKNFNKIVGYWEDCEEVDIGAVLKSSREEYVYDYTLDEEFYRIPGFTILQEQTDKIPVTESTGAALGSVLGGEEKPEPGLVEIKQPDRIYMRTVRIPTRIKRLVNEYHRYVEKLETWQEDEATYFIDEEERVVWVPKADNYLDILNELSSIYSQAEIEVMSTTMYKESTVTKIVVGETLRKEYMPGTQSWQVYKYNEDTKLWDYVDTYKSTRQDGQIDIYFGEAGKYLIYQYQNVKKTVCKRYHYTTRMTLVLDDINMVLGEKTEQGSVTTDEVKVIELEERQSFIQPITESGVWMISADGVSTSAVIRRTE